MRWLYSVRGSGAFRVVSLSDEGICVLGWCCADSYGCCYSATRGPAGAAEDALSEVLAESGAREPESIGTGARASPSLPGIVSCIRIEPSFDISDSLNRSKTAFPGDLYQGVVPFGLF